MPTFSTFDGHASKNTNATGSALGDETKPSQATQKGALIWQLRRVIAMNGHSRRIVDDSIAELFPSFAAISIDGARAIGKTSTGGIAGEDSPEPGPP